LVLPFQIVLIFVFFPQKSFDVEEWSQQSAKRGSSSVTTLKLISSPISSAFVCQIKHTRRQRKGKALSATVQPYFSLPLDIRHARSVSEALVSLLSVGELEGYQSSFAKKEMDVLEVLKVIHFFWLSFLPFSFLTLSSSPFQIDRAPPILILHLKRFWFSEQTGLCEKITKPCPFSFHLTIDKGMFSEPKVFSPSSFAS
jgi:hypothetical protein